MVQLLQSYLSQYILTECRILHISRTWQFCETREDGVISPIEVCQLSFLNSSLGHGSLYDIGELLLTALSDRKPALAKITEECTAS